MPLNPIIGRAAPGGPMRGGLPAFGGTVARPSTTPKRPRADHRSKKSYAGTMAGFGRPVSRASGLGGIHPHGARAHAFTSAQLPARQRFAGVPPVEFHRHASYKPSLMTRIGNKMRRSAAAFGI